MSRKSQVWDNLKSNMGDKVWNAISNLKIVPKDKKKDYIQEEDFRYGGKI